MRGLCRLGRIPGATRVIGKSQGYLGLPVRDENIDENVNGPATPCMTTAWLPDPVELERLALGAAIHIRILGRVHPPITVEVGKAPE